MKNQIKKVLSLVLVAVMCLSVFAISASAAEECTHENKLHAGTTEPTCTGYGYDSYKCADCNKDFVANIVKPLGHNLVQTGETIPASCWREEATVWECDRDGCDKTETRGELTGEVCEEFVDADEDDEPDVTFEVIDGELVGSMICADCGFKHTTDCECGVEHEELVVTADHSHEVEDMTPDFESIVKPTCTEKGSIVYECDNCAYTVKVIINEQHQYTAHEGFAETCEKDGEKAHYTCDLCGKYFVDETKDGKTTKKEVTAADIVIPKAHKYVAVDGDAEKDGVQKIYTVTNNCVLNQKGVYKVECSVCGDKSTKTEEKLEHDWVEDTELVYDATCVFYGRKIKYCKKCNVSEEEQLDPKGFLIFIGDAIDTEKTKKPDDIRATLAELLTNEEYIKLATKTEATCEADATLTYTIYAQCGNDECEFCTKDWDADAKKGTVTIVLEGTKKEHTEVAADDNAPKAPTCTEPGKEAHYICSVCENDIEGKEGDVIEATGHDWSEDYLYCSVSEKAMKICSVCDTLADLTEEELEEFEAPEGVSHVVVTTVVIEATCVTDGETLTYCACCDDLDEKKTVKATGHKYSEEATVIPGSCQEKTLYIYSCVNEGCDGDVEGHNKVVTGELDKTAAGHMAAMEKANDVADKTVIRPATCTEKEIAKYTCTQCDVTYSVVGNTGHNVVDKTEDAQCWLEKDGQTGKWCEDCDKWVGETTPIAWEHTMDGEIAAQSVCGNEWGWAKFSYCSVCEAAERAAEEAAEAAGEEWTLSKMSIEAVKLTVRVEGHETETVDFEGIDETCTTFGVKAFSYCGVCQKADAEAAIAKAQTSAGKDQKWGDTKIQKPMLTCSALTKVEETADCTKDGFTLTYCEHCSEAVIKAFDYANGHDWVDEDEDDVLDFNLDDSAADYDCEEDGYKYYACANCSEHNVIEGTVVPAHHVDAEGNDFTSSCLDIEETTTCIHGHDVEVTHDYHADVEDGVLPTAKEEGYVATICADCGDTQVQVRADLATLLEKLFANQELPEGVELTIVADHVIVYAEYSFDGETEGSWALFAYDVEEEYYVEEIDALIGWDVVDSNEDIVELLVDNEIEIVEDKCVESTHTTAGKVVYVCPCCEAEVEVVLGTLEGIEMEITADSGILAGASIVNGGLVQFTVALNAAELEAAILKAEFYYDPEVLTFVEAKVENIFNVAAADGTLTVETNAVVGTDTATAYGDTMGRVNIIVDASYTANKLPVDVVLNGEDIAFVTLTFRVAADAKYYDYIFGLVTELGNVEGDMLVDVNTNAYFAYAQLDEALEAAREAYYAAYDMYDALVAAGKDTTEAMAILADAEEALDDAEDALDDWIYANYDVYMELDEIYDAIADSTECEYEIAELGNINGDSNINTIDVLAIRQMAFTNMDGTIEAGEYFLAFETLDENGDVVVDEDDNVVTVDKEVNYLAEADINMDGVVGLDDYALLNQYLVGNITYEQLVLTSQATAE